MSDTSCEEASSAAHEGMSSVLREMEAHYFGDVRMMIEGDDLESLESALHEVTARLAANTQEKRRLFARWNALTTGKQEVRRARARNYLDQRLLPIVFHSIETVEEITSSTPASSPGDEAGARSQHPGERITAKA